MTAAAKVRGPWAMPDATQILPVDADRPTWLAERRKGIGGSDASTIAGVNRWSSRYELWLDKTGQLPEKEQTDAMRWGTLLEPVMRQAFTEDKGIEIRRVGLVRSRQHPHLQVSLDGLTADGGIFEGKTTNWRLADEWEDDQVADHAEVQTQHALGVTGRSHGWVVVLVDGRGFEIRRVERDEALIATLRRMADGFWFDHVIRRVAPPIEANALGVIKTRYALANAGTVTLGDPSDVEPLIATWKLAKAAIKEAERVSDEVEAQMRERIGDAETLQLLDTPRLTLKQNGTFSSTRFTEAHPDLAGELTVMKPALDMDRLKTEYPIHYSTYRARVLRELITKKAGK